MIRSMTGYGKKSLELDDKYLTIEVKSLNSRYFDVNLKLPYNFRSKELEIRTILQNKIERGKVDFIINTDNSEQVKPQKINRGLVKEYYRELKSLSEELHTEEDLLNIIMRIPNVMTGEEEVIGEEQWKVLRAAIEEAVAQLNIFREREGQILAQDLRERTENIMKNFKDISSLEPARTSRIRSRINDQLENWISKETIDRNRFEEEIIYYLEKLDITEEKIRLKAHCEYLLQIIDEPGWDKGKKIGFISQEIGREINTIGSKANDSEIQKFVVQMKDELEKVKEQALNIL